MQLDKEKRVRGTVGCLWCKKDNKSRNVPVHLQIESEKLFFWVVSNFTSHLKRVHGIQNTTKKEESAELKQNISEKNVSHNVADSTKLPEHHQINANQVNFIYDTTDKHKIQSNDRTKAQLMQKDTKASNANNKEQHEQDGEQNVDCFEVISFSESLVLYETDLLPNDGMKSAEQEIYEQILDQINSMKESKPVKKRDIQKVHFDMDGKSELVEVAKIAKDGNCLFRSVVHQFYDLELGSNSQETETQEARSKVVSHIKDNLERFKQIIKTCTQIEENEDADYLRYLDTLSKSGEWGGTEALIALSEIYKVNIIIVNEMGPAYMMNDFSLKNKTCILLAYRLSSKFKKSAKKNGGFRNHYDSIINMDVSLIAQFAKLFSKRYLAKQDLDTNVIQTIDDSMSLI